jgi:predicted GNAT superfamily acetyltransferase
MNKQTEIDIRPIEGDEALAQLEPLQREVWGMPDNELIPERLLHALHFNGALLLGAFDGPRLVGFILGVISTARGLEERIDQVAAARLQLYSAIMGVLPAYQGRQIAYRLKLAQREFALQLGIHLVTWTYDPLESRNAWLNIGKLGAICHQYLPNFHGEMGGINMGLPSDRFYVEWWVTSNRVAGRVVRRRGPLTFESLIGGGAVLVNEATFDKQNMPVPPATFVKSNSNLVLVEIPADFQALKRQNMSLALQWRAHTAELFQSYFADHFVVTDFARQQDADGRNRSFYMLTYRHA